MTAEQTEAGDVNTQAEAVKAAPAYGVTLVKVGIAAVWLVILAYVVGLLANELLIEAGKSKLIDKSAFPVNASLLGFTTITWLALPLVYGFIARKWLARDAFLVAPLLAAGLMAAASLVGFAQSAPVAWVLLASLGPEAEAPAWFLFVYQAAATVAGVVVGSIYWNRRKKRAAAAG